MTLRQYLTFVGAITLLVWGLLAAIALVVNPYEAPPFVLAAFYLTAFMALVGTLSLGGFALRTGVLRRDGVAGNEVADAFRQSLILSGLLVALLVMRSRGDLGWTNGFMAVTVAIALEFTAVALWSRRPRRRSD